MLALLACVAFAHTHCLSLIARQGVQSTSAGAAGGPGDLSRILGLTGLVERVLIFCGERFPFATHCVQ